MTDHKKDRTNYSSDEEVDEKELFGSSSNDDLSDDESQTRDIKKITEIVKAKQVRKKQELEKLKEQDITAFEQMIYPESTVSFLSKDTADKSIASIIYTYSDINNLKLREFYNKVSSQYKNAEKFKNLIYYHYYLRLNNPSKYHNLFFNKLSDEQQHELVVDEKVSDSLKFEKIIANDKEWRVKLSDINLPTFYRDYLESLNEKNIYSSDQNVPAGIKVQVKDSEWIDEKYKEHLIDLGNIIDARNKKKKLNDAIVSKLLNDYKTTKKTYEGFLENINKEYNNLSEFILKMGSLVKTEPVKKVKKIENEEPLTIQTFLVRMYLDNPNIEDKSLLLKAKSTLPKSIKIDPKKLITAWREVDEDTLIDEFNFVIDDYISRKKGKNDENSIIEYIADKTNKPVTALENMREIIKQKIYKPEEEPELKQPIVTEEEIEDIEEEQLPEEEEKEEGSDYGEELEEGEVQYQENEPDEGEVEIPQQFNRGRQITVKDNEVYGAKITKLMKTIQIENEKIKVKKTIDKKVVQKTPYRTLSQIDNDYQTGIWIKNYKQTWIIPITEDEEEKSKYIVNTYSIEYKKKTWYKPTKLWFILQCNSLSHLRRLNNKHELVCFYKDADGVEKSIGFRVLYEDSFEKFTELNKDIFTAEDLWKKSRSRPRFLVGYYKDRILDKDEYGARKIALIQLATVLSISANNMMFPDESPLLSTDIEQRIFKDNEGKTLDKYFMDIAKIIVFLDPARIGNYALNFRYNIHSKELNPRSVHGNLSKDVLLPEIFGTDMPGKDEISQVIDRTIFEQRTSLFYDLISSIYNINITISSKTLDMGNLITCSNKVQDDSEILHYNDKGRLYCFSVHEMTEKIRNNKLVNPYTNNAFTPEFINYVSSLVGITPPKEDNVKEEQSGYKFDLVKEINDVLDEIENTCICGKIVGEHSVKSAVEKPNHNFKEKIFCSMECVNNYDFERE